MTSTTYAAWSTIAPISIANAPSVADYPVRIDLTFATGMSADFSDIRFVDSADNALSYWIESADLSSSAVVWVKVASGTEAISIVYGNAAASPESDGDAVFDLFDGFDGTSLDLAKWDVFAGGTPYITVASGTLSIAGRTGYDDTISSTTAYGIGHALRFRGKFGSVNGANLIGFHLWEVGNADTNSICHHSYSGYRFFTYGTTHNRDDLSADTNVHTIDIARVGASSVVFTLDGSAGFTSTTQIPTIDLPVRVRHYNAGASSEYQWVAVRKCQAVEPVCTVGTAVANSSGISESAAATLAFSGAVAPTAAFSADVVTGIPALGVQFTDLSTDGPASWLWAAELHGSGLIRYAAEQNPFITFWVPGPYDISLTVTNAAGSSTETKVGYITVTEGAAVSVALLFSGSPVQSDAPGDAEEAVAAGLVAIGETDVSLGVARGASLALSGAAGAATASDAAAALALSGTGAASVPSHVGAASASLAFSGSSQHLHWIDFDNLPATTTTTDPVTGYPVTYPSGTVAIPAVSASVRRGVSDGFWQLTETVDGVATIPITSLRATKVIRQDHNGTARCVFFGVVPGLTYHLAYQADSTSANGYDYGWYLSQQYVPSAYRIMPATMNPSDFVTAMLGGTFWETATGVRPYRIATVTAWGTAALPAKEFVFEPRTTKWEAIQQLAEYCGFLFFTKWAPVGVADVANPDPSQRVVQVNAVDFDAVEGTGYHDVDATNLGGALRTAEGVDIERFSTERGASVGWIRDGEWLTFTRTFDWTGRYAVSARVAAAAEATTTYWTLYLDGVEQWTVYVGAASTADGGYRTGAYNVFVQTDPDTTEAGGATVASAAQYLDITEGEHVIKVVFGGNVGAAPNDKHQNFAGLTLTPEGAGSAAGADTLYEPVAYWIADADIDSATAGLDLPAPVVIGDPGQYPRDGVEVLENANERYNSVTVRGHSESGVYFEYTASFVTDGLPREHFEESDRIVDAASAQTYALALLDYYKLDQKSYRLSLPQRFDLSLYQLITFVGHTKLPAVACRIVDVDHHSGHQDDWTTIEIIPNTTWLRGRKLRRMLFPSAVHETEAIIDHALAALPQPHIGTCATAGTDTGTFSLEEGGTMTARIVD